MENGEFEKGTISDGTITVFVCATEERGEAYHYLDSIQVRFCDCIVSRAEPMLSDRDARVS